MPDILPGRPMTREGLTAALADLVEAIELRNDARADGRDDAAEVARVEAIQRAIVDAYYPTPVDAEQAAVDEMIALKTPVLDKINGRH